jgi:hypothetical protein
MSSFLFFLQSLWPGSSRFKPGFLFFLVAIPVLLGRTADVSAAAQVSATIDTQTLAVGEIARLTVNCEGGAPAQPPIIRETQGLSFIFNGQTDQFTMINGRVTTSRSYTYAVRPTQEGEHEIPPISIEIDGRAYKTNPIKINVVPPGKTQQPSDSVAFLRLVTPTTSAYVGESFPVEIQLYLRVQGEDLHFPQMQGEGFVYGPMAQPARRQAQIGNHQYRVLVFRTMAVPARSGQVVLGPAETSLVVPVQRRTGNRLGRDWFGMADDLFAPKQRISLTTETATIEVLPLPAENQPAYFTGAVGSYDMAVNVSPKEVKAGDPLTLNIQIAGKGPLDRVNLPAQKWGSDFASYPVKSNIETTDSLGMSGLVTFEQVLIPQSSALGEIPEISFSFFDPVEREYRTLTHPPIPITVLPGPAEGRAQFATRGETPASEPIEIRSDVAHIKARPGVPAVPPALWIAQPWFLALQSIPLALFIASLVWRKREENWGSNPAFRRRQQTEQTVIQGMDKLQFLAQQEEREAFFATTFRLIQSRLGALLNLPPHSITEAVIEKELRPDGVSPVLCDRLHGIFQLCNQARYAPAGNSAGELTALIPEIASLLEELRQTTLEKEATR